MPAITRDSHPWFIQIRASLFHPWTIWGAYKTLDEATAEWKRLGANKSLQRVRAA